jgi:hypothetical protein
MHILSGDALNRSMTSFLGPEASETESGLGVEQPQQSRISCDGSELPNNRLAQSLQTRLAGIQL